MTLAKTQRSPRKSDPKDPIPWRLGDLGERIPDSGDYFLSNVMIQFGSQVLPPSAEEDCSQRADVGVICDQLRRPRTDLPCGSV